MRVVAVAIGRNEGERLRTCLSSLVGCFSRVVYVDSGSTDGSVAVAKNFGAEVVELDISVPFTAARARNAGVAQVNITSHPPDYVQFIDGDCSLNPCWLSAATEFLDTHPNAAVACGRRRERFPNASVYNRLCDREWNTPVGKTRACGGDALMRLSAFKEVGGFSDNLIAGEEPELCVRLRAADWQIWRLDQEMTLHDAAMTSFSQWWQRMRRGGYAYAEGFYLHGLTPERHFARETSRILAWGLGLPLSIFAAALIMGPVALTLAIVYPIQIVRLATREGLSEAFNWRAAVFNTLGKFPEAHGAIIFYKRFFITKTSSGGRPIVEKNR